MKINKLKITVFLSEDIEKDNLFERLSRFVNGAMKENEILSLLHKSNDRYKHYSFSGLYPIEEDKVYKKGGLYSFTLMSPKTELINAFKTALLTHRDNIFVCCNTELIKFSKPIIREIESITPCVITYEGNKSLMQKRLMLIQDRVRVNAIRKYNDIFKKNIGEDFEFIQGITILNNKPIRVNYKNGKIFGFKLKINVNSDEISQDIAKIIVQSGILEKNSIGLGFCKFN